MRREMSPRCINSLMKEPAGQQSQFEGAEKRIDVNGAGDGGWRERAREILQT